MCVSYFIVLYCVIYISYCVSYFTVLYYVICVFYWKEFLIKRKKDLARAD